MLTTLTHTETRPETLEQRRDALDEIAHNWDDITPAARFRRLAEVTTLRGTALRDAMKDLREAMFNADQLSCGLLRWEQYEPGLTDEICDPQHKAWLIACSQVYDAMTVLLRDPVVTL